MSGYIEIVNSGGKRYATLADAARQTGYQPRAIAYAINNHGTLGGLTWTLEHINLTPYEHGVRKRRTPEEKARAVRAYERMNELGEPAYKALKERFGSGCDRATIEQWRKDLGESGPA